MFDEDAVPVALELLEEILFDGPEDYDLGDNDPFVQMALDELEGWTYDCD